MALTSSLSFVPPLLSVLLTLLAILVAAQMLARARRAAAPRHRGWLAGAALGLGVGIWSAQIVALSAIAEQIGAGFDWPTALAALVLCLGLCLDGLHRAQTAPAGRRWLGASVLALAVAATQTLAVHSLMLESPIEWRWSALLLGALGAFAGLRLAARSASEPAADAPSAWRQIPLAAMAAAGAGILVCQALVNAAAAPQRMVAMVQPEMTSAASMSLAVSIGAAELLLFMLLFCAVEWRLRRNFERALGAAGASNHHVDALTGLPTRAGFADRLADVLQQADARRESAAVIIVALDGFKHVNDQHGLIVGDRVLATLARRLVRLAAPHSLARIGGDEFLLLVAGTDAALRANALAEQVLDAVVPPVQAEGCEVELSCSIGLALYPQHGALGALLGHADTAVLASKHAGGGTYSTFDPRMIDDGREQAELLRDLRLALSRAQLELYYQPKVHAPSGQITGVEALLRWHHPQRGLVSPQVFIPMAERSGLIHPLGEWVIDQACRQARQWRDQGLRMRVAINLSVHQLRKPDLSRRIGDALDRHQINPALLTCEITETVAMEDTDTTLRLFTALASLGVHLSIDDFGSGYSSLAYLRKLPATELKIDRGFVLDLEHSEEARKIAEAVVKLAKSLNMQVVAEGVETDAQYRILRALGCDQLQGFLFAKPMAARALMLWAMNDHGQHAMEFRESLFRETEAIAL